MKQIAINRQTLKMRNFANKVLQETPHALFTKPLAIGPSSRAIDTWADLYNLGNAHKKQGEMNQALACYYSAINLRAEFPEAHNNIANILALDARNLDLALQHYNIAIRLKPDYYEAIHNLGMVYDKLGATDKAISTYLRALAQRPRSPETLNSLGNSFEKSGQTDKAISAYETAIQLKPDHCEAYNNLGNCLKSLGRLEDAIRHYQTAISIRPKDSSFHYNLGIVLLENAAPMAARKALMRSIQLDPSYGDAHNALANCYRALNELDMAVQSYERAAELGSEHGAYHFNLANCLKDQGKLHEAVAKYKTAIALEPLNAEFHNNLGIAFKDLSQFEPAKIAFDQAINLKPNSPEAHFNKSVALLKSGQLADGWKLHEWRWQRKDHKQARFKTSKPIWNPNHYERVLVWGEQGLGDQIMFASMLPEFERLCRGVTVAVDKRLIPLFQRAFSPNLAYVEAPQDADENSYDSQISIGSLAQYLRNREDDFKASSAGFLQPDPDRVAQIRAALSRDHPTDIIGISWRSGSQVTGAMRSMPLSTLIRPLLKPGRRFVNLQYGDTQDEMNDIRKCLNVDLVDLSDIDNQQDMEGLAATICACDRVISTTNATVHLAGALNKETHIVLPFANDWRWQTERKDSFWYESVQLYRKPYQGSWDQPVQAIADRLDDLGTSKPSRNRKARA